MKRLMLASLMMLLAAAAAQADVSVGSSLFRIDWKLTPKQTIEGRVYNQYHDPVTRVRLLVEALDSADNVTSTQFGYVFGDIGALSNRYFEVSKVPVADHYRVSVESWEVLEFPIRGGGGHHHGH
jgi:hypothetical protein